MSADGSDPRVGSGPTPWKLPVRADRCTGYQMPWAVLDANNHCVVWGTEHATKHVAAALNRLARMEES